MSTFTELVVVMPFGNYRRGDVIRDEETIQKVLSENESHVVKKVCTFSPKEVVIAPVEQLGLIDEPLKPTDSLSKPKLEKKQ